MSCLKNCRTGPLLLTLLGAAVAVGQEQAAGDGPAGLRPPAVPLVVHDPYFSVWSFSDRLADDWPRHWTGTNQPLVSMVHVDG